jgi:hypothetical protein
MCAVRDAPLPLGIRTTPERMSEPLGPRLPQGGMRSGAAFAVIFGILLPALCLALDPLVFRRSPDFLADRVFDRDHFKTPVLGSYTAFGYMGTIVSMVGLSLWLTLGRFPAFFSGLLAVQGIFAVFLGAALLPYSVVGLAFYGLGILGLAPFLTGFVLARNAARAFRAASFVERPNVEFAAFALGALLAVGLPVLAHFGVKWVVGHSVEKVLAADPKEARDGVSTLSMFSWAPGIEKIAEAHTLEPDPVRRKRLEAAWLEIKGKSLSGAGERAND